MSTPPDTFGITIEALRAYLGLTAVGSPPSNPRDPILLAFMNSAIATMQKLLGRNLSYGLYEDTFESVDQRLYLNEPPIEAIISVIDGTSILTYDDFELFRSKGFLFFKNHWWTGRTRRYWGGPGTSLVKVQYVGGYTTLPPNLYMAVLNTVLAVNNYQSQIASFGGSVKRVSVYDVGVTDYNTTQQTTVNVITKSMEEQLAPILETEAGTLGTWKLHESEFLGSYGGSPSIGASS